MTKANKKAEMAIGVVIAVAIGLLILIVLAVVLFGGGKKWETGTACIHAGGNCRAGTGEAACTAYKEAWINTPKICPGTQVCCRPIINTDIMND